MYNSQNLVTKIKSRSKERNVLIRDMLASCKLNINTLNQISDKKGLSSFALAKIADYLDCSVDYLLGRTDNPEINHGINSETKNNKERFTYNIEDITPMSMVSEEPSVYRIQKEIAILGKVAAGTPILSYEVDYGTIIPENPSASYALIVQGDSMFPVILDRETIEVINQNTLEQGEIGIISVDGSMTCKKFYNFPDHYELRPINPDFEIIYIPKNPSTNLQIRGKVSLTEVQKKRF